MTVDAYCNYVKSGHVVPLEPGVLDYTECH